MRARLARMAGVGAAKRVAAKLVPGAAVLLCSWANSAAAGGLARRATAMYRPAS